MSDRRFRLRSERISPKPQAPTLMLSRPATAPARSTAKPDNLPPQTPPEKSPPGLCAAPEKAGYHFHISRPNTGSAALEKSPRHNLSTALQTLLQQIQKT